MSKEKKQGAKMLRQLPLLMFLLMLIISMNLLSFADASTATDSSFVSTVTTNVTATETSTISTATATTFVLTSTTLTSTTTTATGVVIDTSSTLITWTRPVWVTSTWYSCSREWTTVVPRMTYFTTIWVNAADRALSALNGAVFAGLALAAIAQLFLAF